MAGAPETCRPLRAKVCEADSPKQERKRRLRAFGVQNSRAVTDGVQFEVILSYLAALHVLAILPLNELHLILQAEFQLLKSDFF
jgi:hypothetical protein